MPDTRLTAAQFALPLRIAAAILTVTSVVHGVLSYLTEQTPTVVMVIRAVQVGLLLALTAVISGERSIGTLTRMAFAIALLVPLAILAASPFDFDEVWPGVAAACAILLGAALFAPWPAKTQARLAATLSVAAITIILFAIPRTAFPWTDVVFAVLLMLAAGVSSVWGAHLVDRERRTVRESEARYRSLFESAGDAIALLDADGVIRQANPRLAELLGRPLAELVGRPFLELHTTRNPLSSSEHIVALSGALQRGTHTFRHADGHGIEVDVSYARAEGAPEQLVQAIVRDLTERRALERREIRDQRADALERLAGGVAHQFNNIMGGILTHASVLREDADVRSAAELDEILDAARRGRDLTKELLRFTRSEPLALKPTNPHTLLESVAELARATLPDTVQVEVKSAPDVPPMRADPDHLAQACLELVFNARDAMKGMERGRVTLSAGVEDVRPSDPGWSQAAPGRYVRLSVRDTGRGMDMATRARAFEPFFTTKPMHRAAGMGLARVHGVVRDHKGAIRVDSIQGSGTTVSIIVPLAPPQVAPQPAPAPQAAGPATILVVDDEAIVRHSLRRALTRFGYKVLEAEDGPTAVSALQEADPPVRLVILDLVLPGGGAAILELLRALRPDLKVLVSSGYSPEAETVKDMVRRVEGFLPKPYEIGELRDAVNKALAS